MMDSDNAQIVVTVRKLVMLSLLEVFKDIVPGYRIRVASTSEKDQSVKKKFACPYCLTLRQLQAACLDALYSLPTIHLQNNFKVSIYCYVFSVRN